MQFPNGSQKPQTVIERVADGICIRPNAFVLKLLLIARTANVAITKKDLGYYMLNSLDVLQGKASPYEVLEAIVEDKRNGIEREIVVPGKASSYSNQHINEQLNFLELANLVRFTEERQVVLNPSESNAISLIAETWDKKPAFDVYSYDLSSIQGRKDFQYDWDMYFGQLSEFAGDFATSAASLIVTTDGKEAKTPQATNSGTNLTEFGDEGEELVFNYEKARVGAYSSRLANKVLALGKTRGLGYDIQSVIAEPGPNDEFVKYIEVKSTKRFTVPDLNDNLWVDSLNITRNEWIAAQQHKEFYSIFRVYFTCKGVTIFVITNVAEKLNNNSMQATPVTYRVDFNNSCVDSKITI